MTTLESLDLQLLHEVERYGAGRWTSYDAAVTAGKLLLKARRELQHGDFTAFAERAGLTARTAQRWMQLARAGFDADKIAALGGIRKALDTLTRAKSDTVSHLPGESADDVRRRELESEYADLRDRLASSLVDADADTLESMARLKRLQGESKESRSRINELITENEALRRERTGLEREWKEKIEEAWDKHGLTESQLREMIEERRRKESPDPFDLEYDYMGPREP